MNTTQISASVLSICGKVIDILNYQNCDTSLLSVCAVLTAILPFCQSQNEWLMISNSTRLQDVIEAIRSLCPTRNPKLTNQAVDYSVKLTPSLFQSQLTDTDTIYSRDSQQSTSSNPVQFCKLIIGSLLKKSSYSNASREMRLSDSTGFPIHENESILNPSDAPYGNVSDSVIPVHFPNINLIFYRFVN